MRVEIRLAGFGGQGIVRAGQILGECATKYDNKNAVMMQSYGPEARGGSTCAELIISDEKIDYPVISQPDICLLMWQEAYNKYSNDVKEKGLIIVDEDLVNTERPPPCTLYSIRATHIAETLGKKIVANIVMLGYLISISKILSYESMKRTILTSVPKGTEELNLSALNQGYWIGQKIKKV